MKATERCNTYKFLSECFYLPDQARLSTLRSYGKYAPFPFNELKGELPNLDNLEEHIIDFSRLFIGPLNLLAPPYGSVYIEGRSMLMGKSTEDIIRWYRSEGLQLSINDVPDHIAFELEFMYLLALRQAEAESKGDLILARSYFEKQRDFLKVHLGSWVQPFTKILRVAATTPFYRTLGRVVNQFVQEDILHVNNQLEKLMYNS